MCRNAISSKNEEKTIIIIAECHDDASEKALL